jgi:IS5 family transposase
MGSKRQRGLFDFEDRMREIGEKDPLARLHEVVDWEAFRGPIEKAVVPEPKGPGGRPRFDAIIMFKTLVLQRLYHLSDAQTESMIRDRLSFMRFVGVDLHETIPDEKTIWRFREELIAGRVMDQLWKAFDGELKRLGVQTSRGKIVDASIVESTSKPRKKSRDRGDRRNHRRTELSPGTTD